MRNVLNILCLSRIFDANDIFVGGLKHTVLIATIAFILFLLVGIAFLIYWLAATSWQIAL